MKNNYRVQINKKFNSRMWDLKNLNCKLKTMTMPMIRNLLKDMEFVDNSYTRSLREEECKYWASQKSRILRDNKALWAEIDTLGI